MAVTHVTAVRNAVADLIDATINTGSGTAQLIIRESTTALVAFDLANPAFDAAGSAGGNADGVMALEGTPIGPEAATAAGAADNFIIVDRDAGTVLAGSVSGNGGGGDIEASNINIADSQNCTLDSLTYEAMP